MEIRGSPVSIVTMFIVVFIIMVINALAYYDIIAPELLTASVTSLLVIVTGGYVIFTYRLWREQQRAREQQVNPAISLNIVPTSYTPSTYLLALENVGNGPAKDLNVNLTAEGSDVISDTTFDVKLLNEGDRTLVHSGGDQKLGESELEEIERIYITGNCENVFDNPVEIEDVFEVTPYTEFDAETVDPFMTTEEKLLSELRKTNSQIGRLTRLLKDSAMESESAFRIRQIILQDIREAGITTPKEIAVKTGLRPMAVASHLTFLRAAGAVEFDLEDGDIMDEKHHDTDVQAVADYSGE